MHVIVHVSELLSASVPIILVGNKKDLSTERAVSVESGKEFAAQMNAKFVEIR
jgi:GTPase SAR1 family protein